MQNKPEEIFKYYFTELDIFKIAYSKWSGIVKFVLGSFAVIFVIFYFWNFNAFKFIVLIIFLICFMGFLNYTKWVAVKYFRKSDSYYENKPHLDFGDIRNIKLLEQIHNYNLLNNGGLNYLINIYNRKSDKFKYPKLTIWAFIIASIIQSAIDFCLNAEGKDWDRLKSYVQFVRSNIIIVIASIILFIIAYFILKYMISNIYDYFLNLKSNRYNHLCSILEERVLPLVVSFSSDGITDNEVYNRIIESINVSVYPRYLEKKAKRDCWIERLKRIKNFLYTYYGILIICISKLPKKIKNLIKTIKLKIKIDNRSNNKDNNISE
jgi:hypothetical protein